MSYNSKLASILAMVLGIGTGNASEGLEAVENAEQNRARSLCYLPKNMTPNKEDFESIGFTFEDVGDAVLYQATLPNGWKLESDGGYWTYFIDEKGRNRGSSFYKGALYDRRGEMSLTERFRIDYKRVDTENRESPIKVYVIDTDKNIIFEAGQCEEPYSDEYYCLVDKATDYMNVNYPDWENPSKYWD